VIHDGKGDPYENAAETIRAMLDIFPTVEYIIDLHRLSEYDDLGRAVRTESALGSAQVRLTVSSEGILTRDSLALAMLLRSKLNRGDRRLCLPVVFTDSEYNSTATPYYLKLDVGAVGNSTQEAIAGGELFAEALIELLKK
jgi:stage II sporulation protein P